MHLDPSHPTAVEDVGLVIEGMDRLQPRMQVPAHLAGVNPARGNG